MTCGSTLSIYNGDPVCSPWARSPFLSEVPDVLETEDRLVILTKDELDAALDEGLRQRNRRAK